MNSLPEPTITHTVSERNAISPEEAVENGYPLLAACGLVWIPKYAKVPVHLNLPACAECEAISRRREMSRRENQPHYVYRHYDEQDRLIYVGCTVSPNTRAGAHKTNSWWFDQVARTRLLVFPNREYALARESEAIANEHPAYNIKGRWQHRALWEPEHYANYYEALSMSPDAGARKDGHRQKVADEAERRYGLDLEATA